MISPPETPDPTKNDGPSAIDWDDLKERIREAMRTVTRERADELGLSWNDYLDRLQNCEHHQDESNSPGP